MRAQQVGISVVAAMTALGVILATATVWLFLTDPVVVVDAVNEGQISPFMQNLGRVILEALRGILKYL